MQLGRYKHYKNRFYKVIAVAKHRHTKEELVIYKALYDSEEFGNEAIWARNKEEFDGYVEIDGKMVKRFEFVGE